MGITTPLLASEGGDGEVPEPARVESRCISSSFQLILLSLTLIILFATVELLATEPHPPNIFTPCGAVSGVLDPLDWNRGYVARYSVRYGAAPIDDRRFLPPVPTDCGWTNVMDGREVPQGCVVPGGDGSEDCLFATVILPVVRNGSIVQMPSNLPVVVWLHGGGLLYGSISKHLRNCEMLAATAPNGLIVVALAYRLNTLGWLSTPDLAAEQGGYSGNYGLLDVLSGLRWVHDNIAAFGGDSQRVTILGQSSGGTLIYALLSGPNITGLFHRAISLSGSPNITLDAAAKFEQDASIVAAVGCDQPTTPLDRLACLRAVSAKDLADATPSSWDTPGVFGWTSSGIPAPSIGMNYAGVIHVDGATVKLPFIEALSAGMNPDISLIISNMAAEGSESPPLDVRGDSAAEWTRVVEDAFASWPNQSQAAATTLQMYAPESEIDPLLAYTAMATDYGLTCGNHQLVRAAYTSDIPRASIFLLYNAWLTTADDCDGCSEDRQWPSHGEDWNEMALGYCNGINAPDLQVSTLLQQMVSRFAWSGHVPDEWQWPAANASHMATYVLSRSNQQWPTTGIGTQIGWKELECDALQRLGFDMKYWWSN